MKKALTLALKGKGKTGLNPAVGCVLVKNNRIIGKGYHKHFGGHHAEIEAIKNAKVPIKNSTMFVTLEPCSHYGKTPPCADEIIKREIKKVVIGFQDPNPLVKGKGIKKLKSAGIQIEFENLNDQVDYFYRDFIKFINHSKPYFKLKAAVSLDGKIGLKSKYSKWITNKKSRLYVHKLRSDVDAILIGINTLIVDNPKLNIRNTKKQNQNYKIILDSQLKSHFKLNLFKFNNPEKIIIITSSTDKEKIQNFKSRKINIIKTSVDKTGLLRIIPILPKIYKYGIKDILIEGGSQVFTYFLKEKLIDEIYYFVSNKIIGNDGVPVLGNLNLKSFHYELQDIEIKKFDDNILIHSAKINY